MSVRGRGGQGQQNQRVRQVGGEHRGAPGPTCSSRPIQGTGWRPRGSGISPVWAAHRRYSVILGCCFCGKTGSCVRGEPVAQEVVSGIALRVQPRPGLPAARPLGVPCEPRPPGTGLKDRACGNRDSTLPAENGAAEAHLRSLNHHRHTGPPVSGTAGR